MKENYFLKTIIVLVAVCNFASAQTNTETLKIISYNIWNGFDWGKDAQRRIDLQQWVESQKSDVVALQELCGYTPEKLKEDASKWGHEYSILLKTEGYSVGFTSRFPIELKEKMLEGLHHGALHCKINGIDFLVVHLHPGSIKRRREEASILSKKITEISQTNSKFVVLGDFNAHSPFDADLYASEGTLVKRARKANIDKGLNGNMVNESFDYAVISKFLSVPLYDIVQNYTKNIEERGSFPGRVLGVVNNESDKELVSRLERIDYILVSPELSSKCIEARVHNKKDTWYLSDHYPVSAKFEF